MWKTLPKIELYIDAWWSRTIATPMRFATFESGKEALQACQGKILDVILLDYRLPNLNGLEFITELEKQIHSSKSQ
ncbi:MAG: response regulator [Nostoc sp.]